MVVFALTLIRHGETGANKESIIQGQLDVPLSETGIKQAHLLAQRLQTQNFSHVFASDLSRAKQTAQAILEKSFHCRASIVHDTRLRERKFGEVEGKTYSEMKALARRENRNLASFTPAGGETVQQVRDRAIHFFQDLCQLLLRDGQPATDITTATTATVKQRRHSSVSSEGDGCDVRSGSVVPLTANTSNHRLKRERNDSLSDSSDADYQRGGCEISEAWALTIARSKEELLTKVNGLHNGGEKVAKQLCVYVPTKNRHKKGEGIRKTNKDHNNASESNEPVSSTVRTNNNVTREVNPNTNLAAVTVERSDGSYPNTRSSSNTSRPASTDLTPLVEKKRARQPSVDSNHDELDTYQSANVLVVSHGGLLREMIRHFVEELGCGVPGGKGQALRISPNTGLSKFTVTADEKEKPRIICLSIHDKDHLVSARMESVSTNAL